MVDKELTLLCQSEVKGEQLTIDLIVKSIRTAWYIYIYI